MAADPQVRVGFELLAPRAGRHLPFDRNDGLPLPGTNLQGETRSWRRLRSLRAPQGAKSGIGHVQNVWHDQQKRQIHISGKAQNRLSVTVVPHTGIGEGSEEAANRNQRGSAAAGANCELHVQTENTDPCLASTTDVISAGTSGHFDRRWRVRWLVGRSRSGDGCPRRKRQHAGAVPAFTAAAATAAGSWRDDQRWIPRGGTGDTDGGSDSACIFYDGA